MKAELKDKCAVTKSALPVTDEQGKTVDRPMTGLALSMLLSSLGTSIANVALPTLARAFNASFQNVQWVVLAYLLAITTAIVSAGKLGDIVGRRRLLLAGIMLFTAASVLCGVAPSLAVLIAARVAQGLGAAVMMALTMALVRGSVVKEQMGRAMGLLGTMSAIGTALGPSLGGLLIGGFGWRSIFLINLPLGVLTLRLAQRALPEDRLTSADGRAPFDYAGTILLGLTLAAYALAMTIGRGHFGSVNVALLGTAAAGAVLFVVAEARAASPLIRLEMFRERVLVEGFGMSALVTTVMMTTLVVGPFYLSRSLGLDAALTGLVMSAGPAAVALSGVMAGRFVDRFGTPTMTIAGLAGMAAGSLTLCMMPAVFGIPGYLVPIIVITLGYAMFQTANNTAVMQAANPEQGGLISGMLSMSRNLGLVTGASVMGAVFAVAAGSNDIASASAEAVSAGMRTTFGIATGLMAAALLAFVVNRISSRECLFCGS